MILAKLKALFRRDQLDADIREELAHHQAMQGKPGNRTYWQEETRAEWTFPRTEALAADTRFALRRLAKDKVFTLVAILTLTLGIGATTAVFSLINGLLWRPLPLNKPDELVRLVLTHLPPTERHWLDGKPVPALERTNISFALYDALTKRDQIFAGFFALGGSGDIYVDYQGVPRQANFGLATGSMFAALGLKPQAGRFFEATDDIAGGRPGNAWPAVISDALWTEMFQRSPSAIGAEIVADRIPFSVTGICPPEFKGLNPGSEFDLWLPLSSAESLYPEFRWRQDRSRSYLRPFARLKPGVTQQQAAQYLNAVAPALLAESIDPAKAGDQRKHHLAMHLEPRPGRSGFSMLAVSYRRPLTILLVAVGAVLLIAATNLTSLFLARAVARRHELAIRVSLGAPASRLRRELLLESLLLSIAGVIAGFVLGQTLSGWLQTLVSANIRIDTSFDLRMFAFLAFVLVLVALIAGLGPAIQAGRTPPQGALKHAPVSLNLRGGLIVLQTALSLALAGGAGMMVGSLQGLLRDETGYDLARSVFLKPDLFNAGISREQMPRAYENILGQLRSLPNVVAAGWTDTVPLSGRLTSFTVEVPGQPDLPLARREVFSASVSEGYLAAAGLTLLAGTDLPGPTSQRPNVAVLSESAARRFFGSPQAAIGQRLKPAKEEWLTVVGVAADSKMFNVREARPLTLYVPYWSSPVRPGLALTLRHRGGEAAAVASTTQVLEREAGRLPYVEVRTLDGNIKAAVSTERLLTWLLTAMAALALLISATGLAGLLSYLVEQRQRDFGIRLALGATAAHVRGLIVRYGLTLSAAGLALGALLSYLLRRTLDAFLFGITPADPRIWLAGAALLLTAALVASIAPAWRASRIDPVRMLRND